MKKILLLAALFIIHVTVMVGGIKVKNAGNTGKILIQFDQEYQVIDGFGASDAWRCQMVGKYWPDEKRNAIADLLFSMETDDKGNPKGIGLSIWRFYLGAGSYEQGAESLISDEWRRAECFQLPDGTYDWKKQEGQRWFLQAAKKRGVEKFLAFTISPPVQMTINGKAFSPQKQHMNIQPGKLSDYAIFLANCIEKLQEHEDIKFNYLSPVNEPQWDWMAKTDGKASQEGTPATNTEIYKFIQLLSEQLRNRSLQTQIVLGEAGAINYLYEDVNTENRDDQVNVFFGKNSPEQISGLNNVEHIISGHSYFSVWPLSDQINHRKKLNARIKQVDSSLKYWQTEYCILEKTNENELPGGGGRKRDLGMKTALFVARIIHHDMTVANTSSWQWWTALTRHDFKDGLIYLDDGSSNGVSKNNADYCKFDGYFRDSKLLWALGNYSYFVRPGMIRINTSQTATPENATNVMISAYKNKSDNQVVIVAINCSEKPKKYIFDWENQKLVNNELIPYITSENQNLEKGSPVHSDSIIFPPHSITTLVGKME